MNMDNLLGAILLAGGGGGAVALAVFRALGTKWLDERFGSRLEALRHENAKETEHLKLQISQQLERANKLTQREFDLLPELWQATSDAVIATRRAYIRFSQHADLTPMSEDEVEEYLARVDVPPHHRREIVKALPSERNRLFGRSQDLRYVTEAFSKVQDAVAKLRRYSILLPEELTKQFNELIELTHGAAVDAESKLGGDVRRADLQDAEKLRADGDALLDALSAAVRERLRK